MDNLPKRIKNKTRFSLSVEIKPRKKIQLVGLKFNNIQKNDFHCKWRKIERITISPIDWGDFPPGSKFEIPINSIPEYKKLKKSISVQTSKVKYRKSIKGWKKEK